MAYSYCHTYMWPKNDKCDQLKGIFVPFSIIILFRPQGFDTEVWGEWDSVSCYACGLAAIDPVR